MSTAPTAPREESVLDALFRREAIKITAWEKARIEREHKEFLEMMKRNEKPSPFPEGTGQSIKAVWP